LSSGKARKETKPVSDLTPKILELVARLKADTRTPSAATRASRETLVMRETAPLVPSRTPHEAPTTGLRAAYRRWFILTVAEADGTPVNSLEAQALHQQIVRLTDDAGLAWADAVYADELRRFRWDTARCGACGGLGHDTPHRQEDDLRV
jgi:hypothetical protein